MFCLHTYNGVATVNRQTGTTVTTLRVKNDSFEPGETVAVLTDAQGIKLARAILDAQGINFDDDTEAWLTDLEGGA